MSGPSRARVHARMRPARRRSTGRMPQPRRHAARSADSSHPARRVGSSCQDRGVTRIGIAVGDLKFEARLETEKAPRTCAKFVTMLPLKNRIIQARWSGEAAWIPFGDLELD